MNLNYSCLSGLFALTLALGGSLLPNSAQAQTSAKRYYGFKLSAAVYPANSGKTTITATTGSKAPTKLADGSFMRLVSDGTGLNGDKSSEGKSLPFTLQATAQSGYQFVGWTTGSSWADGGRLLDNSAKTVVYPLPYQLDTDKAKATAKAGQLRVQHPYFANFARVAVKASDAKLGFASIDKLVNADGDKVTLKAVPKAGCSFTGWQLNGKTVSTNADYSLTVAAANAGLYTATFSGSATPAKSDFVNSGYYRIQSLDHDAYMSVVGDNVCVSTANAFFGSIAFKPEFAAVTDPGSVVRIDNIGNSNLVAQGTSTGEFKATATVDGKKQTANGIDVIIEKFGGKHKDNDGQYYGSWNSDYTVMTPYEYPDDGTYCLGIDASKYSNFLYQFFLQYYEGGMDLSFHPGISEDGPTKGNKLNRFYLEPLNESTKDTYYFGAQPSPKMTDGNGNYYTTMYSSFAYKCTDGVEAYYVDKFYNGKAHCQKIASGIVPAKTPVILKCKSTDPVINRLVPTLEIQPAIEGNLLKGVYFNQHGWDDNGEKFDIGTTFDASSMRLLNVDANGNIAFTNTKPAVTPNTDGSYIAANSAYLDVTSLATTEGSVDLLFGDLPKVAMTTTGYNGSKPVSATLNIYGDYHFDITLPAKGSDKITSPALAYSVDMTDVPSLGISGHKNFAHAFKTGFDTTILLSSVLTGAYAFDGATMPLTVKANGEEKTVTFTFDKFNNGVITATPSSSADAEAAWNSVASNLIRTANNSNHVAIKKGTYIILGDEQLKFDSDCDLSGSEPDLAKIDKALDDATALSHASASKQAVIFMPKGSAFGFGGNNYELAADAKLSMDLSGCKGNITKLLSTIIDMTKKENGKYADKGVALMMMRIADNILALADGANNVTTTLELTDANAAENSFRIGKTYYTTLASAIDAAKDGETINMLKDAKESVTLNGKKVNFDFGGYTLTSAENGKPVIELTGDATLDIKNGKFVGSDTCVVVWSGKNNNLTIDDGTFTGGEQPVLSGNKFGSDNNITINGGTITGVGTRHYEGDKYLIACGIYTPGNDVLSVHGGTIKVTNGIGILERAGMVYVDGDTYIETTGGEASDYSQGAQGTVGDDSYKYLHAVALLNEGGRNPKNYPGYTEDSRMLIKGGKFKSQYQGNTCIDNPGMGSHPDTFTSGGTFSSRPYAYLPGGEYEESGLYKVVTSTEGNITWYTVEPITGHMPYKTVTTAEGQVTTTYDLSNNKLTINDSEFGNGTSFTVPTNIKSNIEVVYNRKFSTINWSAWYMPIFFELSNNSDFLKDFELAKLIGVVNRGSDALAPSIAVVKVANDDYIYPNVPYVIRTKEANTAVRSIKLKRARVCPMSVTQYPEINISSTQYDYHIKGIYSSFICPKYEDQWGDIWPQDLTYAINKKGEMVPLHKGVLLKPFRLMMTLESRSDDPYNNNSNPQFAKMAVIPIVLYEDEATAIKAIQGDEKAQQSGKVVGIYDVQGRKVSKPGKGVYIVNGKKVLYNK